MRHWAKDTYAWAGDRAEPDQTRFQRIQRLMASGHMVGKDRPVGRVGISKHVLKSTKSNRPGPWRYLQHQVIPQAELPGIKSIEIDRSLGDDAASCTIVMANQVMATPEGVDIGVGRPGYFTYNRGKPKALRTRSIYNQFVGEFVAKRDDPVPGTVASSEIDWDEYLYRSGWNYPKNSWFDMLIPNRLIRTYQGYGSDNFDEDGNPYEPGQAGYVPPWDDMELVTTGTWLIDNVRIGTDGLITLQCRDLGKLLLEQVVYPPMIPLNRFPLVFCPEKPPSGGKGSASQNRIRYHSAAHELHQSRFRGGYVFGHHPRHAFDGRSGTYYLGHSYQTPNALYSKEWIQGSCGGAKINQLTIHTVGYGYTVYVSVMENGVWQGSNTIPYGTGGAHSHGVDIKYVARHTMGSERITIKLPRAYNASLVRLTFTNLRDFGLSSAASPYPYRVGVRTIEARYAVANTYKKGTIGAPGYINDWSDAIKELIGWAGFTWLSDKNEFGEPGFVSVPEDPLLGRRAVDNMALRVWGDIEELGAGPIECTPADFFLNKSFMECFVGETLIQTPHGPVPIKDVKEGQRVFNAAGTGTVTYTRAVQKRRLVEVEIGGEVFHCSEEHPFFTTRGWVRAARLRPGDRIVRQREAVRLLRNPTPEIEQAVLQSALSSELDHRTADQGVRGLRQTIPWAEPEREVLLAGMHSRGEADSGAAARVRGVRQGIHAEEPIERDWVEVLLQRVQGSADEPQSRREGGDWTLGPVRAWRPALPAIPALAGARRDGGGLVRRVLGDAVGRDSGADVVHDRRGAALGEDRRGGGWAESHLQRIDRDSGPTDGGLADCPRVDRVAVLEPGDPGWAAVCGDEDQVTLYDLTVSGHPSFSVGEQGLLVHNCCKTIADFLGCVFFIDEWGRVNFRFPNIFDGGNLPQNPHLSIYSLGYRRGKWPIEFHEGANLLDYSITIDDSQVRSEVLVVGTNPDVNSTAPLAGGVVLGAGGQSAAISSAVNFTNVLAGQYRLFLVPGEQTKGFKTVQECQRMAELIGLKILFSYRKGSAKILGHPYLQIDDQVRIYERITNETNVHYVSSISSQMDLEAGEYTMDVTTHWLGENPLSDWFLDYIKLTPAVRNLPAIYKRMGSAGAAGGGLK